MQEIQDEAQTEKLPIEASGRGDNTLYLDYCASGGNRPAYCACISKVIKRKEGRLDSRWAECSAAIGKKTCPAMALMKQEKEAGHALFYIPRATVQAANIERVEAGNEASIRSSFKDEKKRKQALDGMRNKLASGGLTEASETLFGEAPRMGYASAINVAIAEAKEPVKVVVVPITVSHDVVRAASIGGGLAAIARAMLGK